MKFCVQEENMLGMAQKFKKAAKHLCKDVLQSNGCNRLIMRMN